MPPPVSADPPSAPALPASGEARRLAVIAEALAACGQRPDLTDDCAWLRGRTDLVSCDALVEGVHFDLRHDSFRQVGAQAAVCNLSDLAGSGGAAGWAVWSLNLPATWDDAALRALTLGFAETLSAHGARLVGGNLSQTQGPAQISVTVGGPLAGSKALTRSGARPGDLLYVTGPLGDSALGWMRPSPETRRRRHQWRPHLQAAAALAQSPHVTAAMDISDGLLKDAGRLAEASGLSLEIRSAQIPVSDHYRAICGADRRPALIGGEDYVLLFTADPAAPPPCRAWAIGRCVEGDLGALRVDGERAAAEGYDHFMAEP